jgi:hypothetical protein
VTLRISVKMREKKPALAHFNFVFYCFSFFVVFRFLLFFVFYCFLFVADLFSLDTVFLLENFHIVWVIIVVVAHVVAHVVPVIVVVGTIVAFGCLEALGVFGIGVHRLR